jgi:hypothetical protein
MKTILYPFFIFIAMGFLFSQCDDDPQTKMNGTLSEHSACKNFLVQNSSKFDVADTTTSVVFTYSENQNLLILNHINAAFNCCPDDLYCEFYLSGDTIHVHEFEESALCDCNCLYDLTMQINQVVPGVYKLKFHEPYVGNQPMLFFELNLTQDTSGTFTVTRTGYPWGM